MELKKIHRPSLSLIKLVESVGLLLGVPKSEKKSVFKAPIPSNYDNTIEELCADYSGLLGRVASIQSQDLSNEAAAEFYSKTFEPGFSYELAVNTGGLCARDLFNAIALVLVTLQTDVGRIPIAANNIFVLVTGSRSSYAALDAATHIFKHGVVTVSGCIVEEALPERESAMLKEHLSRDLLRRIKMLYKLPDHCFNLESMLIRSLDDAPEGVVGSMQTNGCHTLVMGLEEDAVFGEGGDGALPIWAVSNLPSTDAVMLVKGRSKIRPFSVINTPRSFVVFVDGEQFANQAFLDALAFARPGDSMEVVFIAELGEPLGDSRDDRFGFGRRVGWVASSGGLPGAVADSENANGGTEESKQSSGLTVDPVNVANTPGWNDEAIAQLSDHLRAMLGKARIPGNVHVLRLCDDRTVASTLCALALQLDADVLCLSRARVPLEVCVSVVQEAPCSVLLN